MLKIWDWMSGKVIHEIDVLEHIEPFIKVLGGKRGEGEEGEVPQGTRRKGKGKKSKGKGKKGGKGKDGEAPEVDLDDEGMAEGASTPNEEGAAAASSKGDPVEEQGEKRLVVQRIETLQVKDYWYIVFCAIGWVSMNRSWYIIHKYSAGQLLYLLRLIHRTASLQLSATSTLESPSSTSL